MAEKKIKTPDVGGSEAVTVTDILVKKGDKIEVDTPIVELESDKATMEVPSTDAGVVKEIKVEKGSDVKTGDVLVILDADGAGGKADDKDSKDADADSGSSQEDKDEDKSKSDEKDTEQAAKQDSEKKKKPADDMPEQDSVEKVREQTHDKEVLSGELETDGDIHAGPGVRRFARELGVNLNQIRGTGPKDRILKEDVQTFVKGKMIQAPETASSPMAFPAAPAVDFSKFGAVETKELSRIQKISGKNLARNWVTIPHVTQFGEADITSLEDFRKDQKKLLEKDNIKLTPIVFVMKAMVSSLKAFPHFNASLDASGENLVMKKYFHIGVAVDTPNGLMVPVIRDVDKKGLIELAKELGEISEKARNKKLTPEDMQGGSISISSLGGIGGTAFTPIINAPEVAILGVSRSTIKPVYEDGEFVPRLMVPLSLSYDHRVIDGADGARFMVHLTNMLSDIRNLLM